MRNITTSSGVLPSPVQCDQVQLCGQKRVLKILTFFFFSEGLEKIIHRRLSHLEKHSVVKDISCGFRKQRETESSPLEQYQIRERFETKQLILNKLFKTLSRYGIRGTALGLFNHTYNSLPSLSVYCNHSKNRYRIPYENMAEISVSFFFFFVYKRHQTKRTRCHPCFYENESTLFF